MSTDLEMDFMDEIPVEKLELTSTEFANKFSWHIQFVLWAVNDFREKINSDVYVSDEIVQLNIRNLMGNINLFRKEIERIVLVNFDINAVLIYWNQNLQFSFENLIKVMDIITKNWMRSRNLKVQKFFDFYKSFKEIYIAINYERATTTNIRERRDVRVNLEESEETLQKNLEEGGMMLNQKPDGSM